MRQRSADLETPALLKERIEQPRDFSDSSIEEVAKVVGVSPEDIITAYRSGQLSMKLWLRPNDVEEVREYFRLRKLGPVLDKLTKLLKSPEHANDFNLYRDRIVAYSLADDEVIAVTETEAALDVVLAEKGIQRSEVLVRRFFAPERETYVPTPAESEQH